MKYIMQNYYLFMFLAILVDCIFYSLVKYLESDNG